MYTWNHTHLCHGGGFYNVLTLNKHQVNPTRLAGAVSYPA